MPHRQSRFAQFSAPDTSHEIVPFGVRELHDVFIFPYGHALIRDLDGRTAAAGGTKSNFDGFHLLHLLSKRWYTLNLALRSRGTEKMLTIGNVAKRVGIRSSAIRYYEKQGLVRPAVRGANGYRFFGENAVKMLLFVKRAQALGITLKEVKPLVMLASRGQRPCTNVKQVAKRHLNEVSEKIRELELLREDLRTLLKRKAGRPHAHEVCPLIEGA